MDTVEGTVARTLKDKLTAAFAPATLTITDESHLHAGHSGARPEGETHFRVAITSTAFAGRSRVDRHRMVNEVLRDELAGRVHALALSAEAPV